MRFAALKARWFRGYLVGGSLMMAGDNLEHAITYWVMWQSFHSPLLAGFAVVSHWLPALLFSIPLGALADRIDCRRLIQLSAALFMAVSVTWGVLFATRSLQPWECMVLLVTHGFAASIWNPADQLLIYDIVGVDDLPSGVRLMATGMNLGQLVGPGVGAVLLFTVGPTLGIFLNVALYLPFFVYLMIVPFTGHRTGAVRPPPARLRDIVDVLRDVPRFPSILVVMILQGAVGLFIGTALLPLFPEFGTLLGVGSSGLGYGVLVIALSAGAVMGGLSLEAVGRIRASTRLAIAATVVFAIGCLVFAFSRSFGLSVLALFLAGSGNLVSSSTSQTIVQLEAPPDRRGRFVGASGMTGNGFRVGSGLLIGLLGGALGVTAAVSLDSAALLLVALVLGAVVVIGRRRAPSLEPDTAVSIDPPGSDHASARTPR